MSSSIPLPLPSPGVGARRKGPKTLPKLPLSIFTPPNTGSSEKFPLPPSPDSLQPSAIADANVIAPGGDLSKWEREAAEVLDDKASGVIVSLRGTDPKDIEKAIKSYVQAIGIDNHLIDHLCRLSTSSSAAPVLAILVPFNLEEGVPTEPPAYLATTSTSGPRIVLSAVYSRLSTPAVDALRWAIERGFTVDLDIETNLRAGEGAWEDLEELLTKSIPDSPKGNIIICTSAVVSARQSSFVA